MATSTSTTSSKASGNGNKLATAGQSSSVKSERADTALKRRKISSNSSNSGSNSDCDDSDDGDYSDSEHGKHHCLMFLSVLSQVCFTRTALTYAHIQLL
jgi:hypothetical protein